MRSYRNTFRYRTSDQRDQNGQAKFLRSFASDVIDLLPEERWDRLLVIRSAPGAGKTSLLRAFEPSTLLAVVKTPEEYPELAERLTDAGALEHDKPLKLGARVSMRSDFRDLVDLELSDEGARKLFFRFLDAQIIQQFLHSVSELCGLEGPTQLNRVRLSSSNEDPLWARRLGGVDGRQLYEWSESADDAVRRLLDSVLPISMDEVEGHAELYSLKALSQATLTVDGQQLDLQPLVMIDDGQWLHGSQRRALLAALVQRDLTIGRWYTERHEALDPDEIIGDGEPSRRYKLHDLERETRKMAGSTTTSGGRRIRAFESMLLEVADIRASRPLVEYGDDLEMSFAERLDGINTDTTGNDAVERAVEQLLTRLSEAVEVEPRYREWLSSVDDETSLDTAIRLRELEILIEKDDGRPQQQLLDVALDESERRKRSTPAIRDAAWLFIHREFNVPYYFGPDKIAKLGDHNFDQFLRLAGDVFDEMLALLTLGRRPVLSPTAQERIVTAASAQAWKEIPQRRSHGRDIQHVLTKIGRFARTQTYRPRASYAPGVSGVALSMRDRARLLDPDFRDRTPGGQALFNALGGAVGHNLLNATLDHRNKGDEWMVMYLNRLLCVRYGLPIGLGGWRPVPLEEMCDWLAQPPTGDLRGQDIDDQLLLDL